MITRQYICLVKLKLKLCASDFANEFVRKKNLGHEDADEFQVKSDFLSAVITTLDRYRYNPVLNLKKVKVSEKGRFFLKDKPESLTLLKLKPDAVNCLTEKSICELINKAFTLCPNY